MLVAGVLLSMGAVALLARLLHNAGNHELATHVGFAVDANRAEVRLSRQDRVDIAAVLASNCPGSLATLRTALD